MSAVGKFVNDRNVFFCSGGLGVTDHMVPVDSMSGEDPFFKHSAVNGRKDGNTDRTGNLP